MDLNFVEKKVVKAVVEDLQSNPDLVGEIQEVALMQLDPFDFHKAIESVIRVRGLGSFPRLEAVLESYPKGVGMGLEFSLGDAFFSLLEIGVVAGAGYMGAKLLADSQEDMFGDKMAFEQRMADRQFEADARGTAAMEEYNRQIKRANDKKQNNPAPNYRGSGRGAGAGAETDDELPTWLVPAAIGAGALVVGYVALK
jgi:hypothetical protein